MADLGREESSREGPEQVAEVTDGRAFVAVLGLNCWVVILLVPLLGRGAPSALPTSVVAAAALGTLTLGVRWLGAARSDARARTIALARLALLAAFPPLLMLGRALLPPSVKLGFPFGLELLLAALSLLGYGAAAALAVGTPRATRRSTVRGWAEAAPAPEPRVRRQRLALGVGAAVALALSLAPLWGGLGAFRARWGESAAEGAVLTALVAGALGAVVVAMGVGPMLRASRIPSKPLMIRRFRALGYFAAAALGVATYVLLRSAEP